MRLQLLIFTLIVSLITACSSQDESTPPAEATNTAIPAAEATPDVVSASLGEELFNRFYEEVGFSCANCHYTNSDTRLLGPGLLSIEERFESYEVEAESLETYLVESIVAPEVFIVPDDSPYPANLMPRTYGELLTEDEIDALVEYILSF